MHVFKVYRNVSLLHAHSVCMRAVEGQVAVQTCMLGPHGCTSCGLAEMIIQDAGDGETKGGVGLKLPGEVYVSKCFSL